MSLAKNMSLKTSQRLQIWDRSTRGCLRGKLCSYFHNSGKKGINIITKNNKSEREVQNITIDKEMSTEKKYDTLKEAVEANKKVIKEKEEEIARLRLENESLMENNNKIKRIAWNMDQEIKVLMVKLN